MQDIAAYFAAHADDYFLLVREHISISLISILVALLVGAPLGFLSSKGRLFGAAAIGLFSTLRVIPSLAVLLLCIPIMGTGVKPAVIALSFLAVPPILINTALAFRSMPSAVLETALAMGMGRTRTFFKVKLPLALPLMLAGLKTALVEVIASATLAAYIGAGGLGSIIFTGLGLMRSDLLLIGGVSVACLSLLSGFLLSKLELRLVRHMNH
jgi:osmoprotectant transport system permease protein